jgi:hypothetical protein
MASETLLSIENLDEVLRKLDSPKLLAKAVRNFLTHCAVATLNTMRDRAPHDTGRLWSNLTFQPGVNVVIDDAEIPSQVIVGTNVNADGFPYPKALDIGSYSVKSSQSSGLYHYRGKSMTEFYGKETMGWFSEAPGLLTDKYRELGDTMLDEIKAEWSKA